MQCEGQVAAVTVVPVVFMPCDVILPEEVCTPQQGVPFSELDDLAAAQPGFNSIRRHDAQNRCPSDVEQD